MTHNILQSLPIQETIGEFTQTKDRTWTVDVTVTPAMQPPAYYYQFAGNWMMTRVEDRINGGINGASLALQIYPSPVWNAGDYINDTTPNITIKKLRNFRTGIETLPTAGGEVGHVANVQRLQIPDVDVDIPIPPQTALNQKFTMQSEVLKVLYQQDFFRNMLHRFYNANFIHTRFFLHFKLFLHTDAPKTVHRRKQHPNNYSRTYTAALSRDIFLQKRSRSKSRSNRSRQKRTRRRLK